VWSVKTTVWVMVVVTAEWVVKGLEDLPNSN
jgi:hypothetical protein